MSLEIGQILGHYKILGALGAGGMGEVYRARDTKLQREVAVKILPSHVANNPDSLGRFEREALTLAQLSHPNIVAIHDFGTYSGFTLAVTELLEGETLRSRMTRSPIPTRRALEICASIADGLAAAHSKGIVHRDLKPENVFLTADGQVKILDFGLARIDMVAISNSPNDTSVPTQTDPGLIKGTLGYMSPEQLRGQEVDARSDIFALGCVLYEMLAGKRAFAKDTAADTMTAVLTEELAEIGESGRQIAPDAELVISHCLEKDPVRRFQSAKDLALHLKTLISSPEISDPGLRALTVKKRPWLWLAAASLLIVVTLVAFLFYEFRTPRFESSGRPSVAVLYFDNDTGDSSLDWLRMALTNMLVTDLSQSNQIEVLGTDRLYQILTEMGETDARTTSYDVVRQLSRKAGVTTVILGNFVKAGDTFRLSTRLQETETGRILATETVEGSGEESLFQLVDEITRRVKTTLEVSLVSDEIMDRGIEEVTTSSVEAYRHFVEGNSLHTQSKEEEAIAPLEKAVEIDPNFAMAYAKLSVVHWNLGHQQQSYDYARMALERAQRLSARERYYVQGRFYSLNPETMGEAVSAYQQAIRLYPDHGPATHNLANIYLEFERYDEAIALYSDLVKRGTTFAGTFTNLANAYATVGKPEEGLQLLRDFNETHKNSLVGHRDLGIYLFNIGRTEEAMGELRKAEAISPENLQVQRTLCLAAVLAEDWDEAAGIADRLSRSDEPWPSAAGHALRAIIAAYVGDLKTTEEQFRKASEMASVSEPLKAAMLAETSRFYLHLDRLETALELAQQARQVGKGFPIEFQARILESFIYAEMGETDRARQEFNALRPHFQAYPPRIVERSADKFNGWVARTSGKNAEAINLWKTVAQSLPDRGSESSDQLDLFYDIGLAHLDQNNFESAISWLERIPAEAAGRAGNPVVYVRSLYYLGKAHAGLGQLDKARQYFSHFLEHWGSGEIDPDKVVEARRALQL